MYDDGFQMLAEMNSWGYKLSFFQNHERDGWQVHANVRGSATVVEWTTDTDLERAIATLHTRLDPLVRGLPKPATPRRIVTVEHIDTNVLLLDPDAFT